MCVEINYHTSTSDLECHTNQNVKPDDVPLSNFLQGYIHKRSGEGQ